MARDTIARCPLTHPESGSNEEGPRLQRDAFRGSRRESTPPTCFEMTDPLCATPMGGRNPASILTRADLPPLTESPDSIRLSGPCWTPSGLTLQAPCRLYAGNHWRAGTVAATGETFALIRTSGGLERCSDRRNLQSKEEAEAFKRQTAAFRRLLKKRQEGGRTNG